MISKHTPIPDDYLATGFANVDARTQIEPFAACLTLLDTVPYFRAYKERSYELLELKAGQSILEVGCGLGDDLRRMAQRLGGSGRVVGADASLALLDQARCRLADEPSIELVHADARQLPFPDDAFHRCRIDRTLQHIQHPEQVIAEMARVLKPGGLMLAYDNDWGTFSINGQDDTTSRQIEDLWTDAMTNRTIGRHLTRLFRDAGLQPVCTEPSVSVLTDFELADRVYNLRATATLAIHHGKIEAQRVSRWLEDLQGLTRASVFMCSLTTYSTLGRKP